jgi:hypothetical protein
MTIFQFIILAITCEALTLLFFEAAPLQNIRQGIIKATPFFSVTERGHVFECKYCTSVWIGFYVYFLFLIFGNLFIKYFCYLIIIGRASNYVHALFSIMTNSVINLRLMRLNKKWLD